MILPVIMAGGSGSRLWPLSRDLMPKQFLTLYGKQSLLQTTLQRLQGLDIQTPLVICNEEHRFIAAEQLRQIQQLNQNIILEPVGRNTAPAIAIAAMLAKQKDNDPLLLVLAADHLISNTSAFQQAITQAKKLAVQQKLVTFGVVPDTPETGYGYIRKGDNLAPDNNGYTVAEFVEKPNLTDAQRYLASGQYYWNSGIFMFQASVYLAELHQHHPAIYRACEQAIADCIPDMDFIRINKEAFIQCPSDSIDYAVMEKTRHAAVVPLNAGWSDIGSWSSLYNHSSKDNNGNACIGEVIPTNSHNNYIYAKSSLVATVGIQDLVVVQTEDAVLVAAKDKVQNIKTLVEQLKATARPEYKVHREVYRPWGKYVSIDNGARYQVKRITVSAGQKLSLQKHHHRSEHWIVVSGTALVTLDKQQILLSENQSIYIPLGATHSLENPGKIPLELIEVQSGSYLGEDDIIRLADYYGRL